jgi:hypothetical protein
VSHADLAWRSMSSSRGIVIDPIPVVGTNR